MWGSDQSMYPHCHAARLRAHWGPGQLPPGEGEAGCYVPLQVSRVPREVGGDSQHDPQAGGRWAGLGLFPCFLEAEARLPLEGRETGEGDGWIARRGGTLAWGGGGESAWPRCGHVQFGALREAQAADLQNRNSTTDLEGRGSTGW